MEIDKNELAEIIESYGLSNLVFDTFRWVEPDTAIYIYHDKNNIKIKYCLMASDYLGGYEDLELPYDFEFDYEHPYSKGSFRAVKIFQYKNNAKKKADGYIDDNHYWTKASNGYVCMLFAVEDLKI